MLKQNAQFIAIFVAAMRYFYFSLLLACLATSGCHTCVQGTGELQEEIRILPTSRGIAIHCSADVIFKQKAPGDKDQIIMAAQANLLPLITTRNSGNILNIDMEGCTNSDKPIQIFVFMDQCESIEHGGSGNITSEYAFESETLQLDLSGTGSVALSVNSKNIKADLDGSGKLDLSGSADFIEVDTDGSGDLDASKLTSIDAKVNLNGSGNVYVCANREMDLHLHGSGSIVYSGNPETINTSDNGSGEIRKAQ